MKYVAITLLALVSTIAVSAHAEDDPFAENGLYIGVGASYGINLFEDSIEDAFPGDAKISDTWGANARLGFRFHKFLAAEAEYEWLNHFGVRVGGVGVGTAELQTITANLKAIAPYRHWQPYVLVGFGVTLATVDRPSSSSVLDFTHTSYSTRFGLGVDYYFTENIALNLGSEFVVNTAKISNNINGDGGSRGFDYFAAQGGLVFKF